MRYILSFILTVIVAIVAFGSWYGGINSSKVEAGFAPLAVTEMVIDGTTANMILGVVETTTTAEILITTSELKHQFENKIIDVNDAISSTPAVVKRAILPLLDRSGQRVGDYNNYMTYHRYSARHSIIGWIMPYLT